MPVARTDSSTWLASPAETRLGVTRRSIVHPGVAQPHPGAGHQEQQQGGDGEQHDLVEAEDAAGARAR